MSETTVVVHWRVNRQTVLRAEAVVFETVSRCDVDEPGAGVAGDEPGRIELAGAIAERMLELQCGKLFGWERLFAVIAPAAFLGNGGQQTAEQNVFFTRNFDLDVLEFAV